MDKTFKKSFKNFLFVFFAFSIVLASTSLSFAKLNSSTVSYIAEKVYKDYFKNPLVLTKDDIKAYEILSNHALELNADQKSALDENRAFSLTPDQVKAIMFASTDKLNVTRDLRLSVNQGTMADLSEDGDILLFSQRKVEGGKDVSTFYSKDENSVLLRIMAASSLVPQNKLKSLNEADKRKYINDVSSILVSLKPYKDKSKDVEFLYNRLKKNLASLNVAVSEKAAPIREYKFKPLTDMSAKDKKEVKAKYEEFKKSSKQKSENILEESEKTSKAIESTAKKDSHKKILIFILSAFSIACAIICIVLIKKAKRQKEESLKEVEHLKQMVNKRAKMEEEQKRDENR